MVNKKGWLRIVEATLAALLVLGALIVILGRNPSNSVVDYSRISYPILDEMAQNTALRDDILKYDLNATDSGENNRIMTELNDFVRARLRNNLNYRLRICAAADLCALDSYQGEVYASERIISSSINNQASDPKKVKIFIFSP